MSNLGWVENSGYRPLELYANGGYKSFAPTIETWWKLGEREVKLPADQIVKFYDNGQLESMTVSETFDLLAFSIPVTVVVGSQVEFYENGAVRKITLAEQNRGIFRPKDWLYRGRSYPPGSVVEFLPDGQICMVT